MKKMKKMKKKTDYLANSVEAYVTCRCHCSCYCLCGCRSIFASRFKSDFSSRINTMMGSGAKGGNSSELSN